MNKEWRPQDWGYIAENIRHDFIKERSVIVNIDVFEAGASAMLKAVIEWLFGPCTEHPVGLLHSANPKDCPYIYEQHRKDCPRCWVKFKGGNIMNENLGCQCNECRVIKHDSDCAVHNEPALSKGACDCSAKEKAND